MTTPSIYVGTYHKYNCGSIYGEWINPADFDSKEEFYEHCKILHGDEVDPEFMFQDHEGFPNNQISECGFEWDFIESYKQAESENLTEAFIAYVNVFDNVEYISFRDAYVGEFCTSRDFVEEMIEDSGELEKIPSYIRNAIDWEHLTNEIMMDYHYESGYIFQC